MNKKSFLWGAVFGAAVAALLHVFVFRPPMHFRGPPRPEQMERFFMKRLAGDLSLSSQQIEAARPIIRRMHIKMMEKRLADDSEIENLMIQVDNELAPILDQRQRDELAKIRDRHRRDRAELKEFIERHREPGGPARAGS